MKSDQKLMGSADLGVMIERLYKFENESFALVKRLFYKKVKQLPSDTDLASGVHKVKNVAKFMIMLEETTDSKVLLLPIKQNSLLHESMCIFVLEYHQHGLMLYLEMRYYEERMSSDDCNDEPQVLTVEMMSAGFIIWLVCILICIIVFLSEIIIGRISHLYMLD